MNFDLVLAHPPTAIDIHSVSAYINTIYTIKSIKDPSRPVDKITRKLRMFTVNSALPPDSQFASDTSSTSPECGTPIATSPSLCHHPVAGDSGGVPPPSRATQSTAHADTPLHTIAKGQSYQLFHMARVPSDDLIRPSTLPGTNTPINVAHELVFEVLFKAQDADDAESQPKGRRAFRVERSVTISSVSFLSCP